MDYKRKSFHNSENNDSYYNENLAPKKVRLDENIEGAHISKNILFLKQDIDKIKNKIQITKQGIYLRQYHEMLNE